MEFSLWYLGLAAAFGLFMAWGIGANDVANNVGPAVGARALTMMGALVIAVIFECAGALIAGGDVVRVRAIRRVEIAHRVVRDDHLRAHLADDPADVVAH